MVHLVVRTTANPRKMMIIPTMPVDQVMLAQIRASMDQVTMLAQIKVTVDQVMMLARTTTEVLMKNQQAQIRVRI